MRNKRTPKVVCLLINQISLLAEGHKYNTVEMTNMWAGKAPLKDKPLTPAEKQKRWVYHLLSDITSMLKHVGICTGDSKNTMMTSMSKNLGRVDHGKLWMLWRCFETSRPEGTDCPSDQIKSGYIQKAWRYQYDPQLQEAVEDLGLDLDKIKDNYEAWLGRKEELREKSEPALGIVVVNEAETEAEKEERLREASLASVEDGLLTGTMKLAELSPEVQTAWLARLWPQGGDS